MSASSGFGFVENGSGIPLLITGVIEIGPAGRRVNAASAEQFAPNRKRRVVPTMHVGGDLSRVKRDFDGRWSRG